jgi:NhaP-type Na+/H+ or K+/H+ antiporter
MIQILSMLVFAFLGGLAGLASSVNPVELKGFSAFTSIALVIGLYGSVIGIDLPSIQRRKWLALIIITVAVPLQILATGVVMYLIYPAAISFLLAVAIDQIDPISTATLLQDKQKMSEEAKGLLRVWAAFDDPVTVLFGFFILLPLVSGHSLALAGSDANPLNYLGSLALNLIPALLLWLVYRYTIWLQNKPLAAGLLVVVLVYAFLTNSYLLAAISGLLLRPIPEKYFQRVIQVLYYVIVFIVGMAIASYGLDLRLGILLAVAEFFVVQPLSALVLFNGRVSDVFRIAYAQQNGLTTLLMGIAFESLGLRVLHILLPAILAVNLFNLGVNKLFSWKEERGYITD